MAFRIIILSVLIIAFMTVSAEAGWLIYHEPEFNGKVLDIDTKQPIEGAVVVVEYERKIMGIGASMSSVMDVRETLTDKEGKFHIPSYTTLIQPFSWQIEGPAIIYKPGYGSVVIAADFFSGKYTKEFEGSWPGPEFKGLKYRISSPDGILELPKLSTREQRLHSMPSTVPETDYKDQKLLIQLLNEENKSLGLKGQYEIKE